MKLKKSIGIALCCLMITTASQSQLVYAENSNKIEVSTMQNTGLQVNKESQKNASENLKSINNTRSQDIKKTRVRSTNSKTQDFIDTIATDAVKNANDYGLYPSVTIAQAILESGSGKSSLSKEPYHNLFGIKGSYKGQSVKMRTGEHDKSGNKYSINANFRRYPDFSSSLKDHNELLRNRLNGYYSCTWRENADNAIEAAKCLQGKYATDVNYANKLINIIDKYNLQRFDEGLIPNGLKSNNHKIIDNANLWKLPNNQSVIEIDDKEINKVQTWGSAANDFITFNDKITNVEDINWKEYPADKYYVEEVLGIELDLDQNSIKENSVPKPRDIAVYETTNRNNELIEKYAIVEGFREDGLLISEGIETENGFQEVYRIILKDSIDKYKFIDYKSLIEANRADQ